MRSSLPPESNIPLTCERCCIAYVVDRRLVVREAVSSLSGTVTRRDTRARRKQWLSIYYVDIRSLRLIFLARLVKLRGDSERLLRQAILASCQFFTSKFTY
jgi:hypothetical protein